VINLSDTSDDLFAQLEAERSKHAAAAAKWMRENPQAMELFERFALEAAHKRRRFGIGALAERVRWECHIGEYEDFKINNNYRAYIARELVRKYPHLAKFIEFRTVKAERASA